MTQGEDDPYTVVRPGRTEATAAEPGYQPPTNTLASYKLGDVIGKGGMGEVVAAQDLRVGREVAIKRLNAEAPTEADIHRFLREARIQARLDHPAIVPVHELGRDDLGRPYFTMKRLTGATLRDQLPEEAAASQRLLRAFADVCLAVEFAHERGVVHRDLKPSNIMLGDYGEVYVLDWGLARVSEEAPVAVVKTDLHSLDGSREPSQLLGTPGYIAPEQLATGGDVGLPADIYALGAILFEVLTKHALHPRATQAAIASTLSPLMLTSPAQRYPGLAIPLELDAVCTAALAMEPTARPTAQQIADQLQAYLDGDRDLARRRAVAQDQLGIAQIALGTGDRAEAMSAAGRALALDPECADAAELITSLMLEPPAIAPLELRVALREADAAGVSRHARTAIVAYLALAAFLPIAAWNGVQKWPEVLAVFGAALALAFAAWRIRRAPERSFVEMMAYAVGNGVLLALVGRMAGPFMFVPALACVVTMSVMAYPKFIERSWVLILVIIASFLVPIGLEARGLLASTWELHDGALTSRAGALVLSGPRTLGLLVGATLATVGIAGVLAAALARTSRQAQQQLVTQAWHLRQLLPSTSR